MGTEYQIAETEDIRVVHDILYFIKILTGLGGGGAFSNNDKNS
jgi:hypothetical protein